MNGLNGSHFQQMLTGAMDLGDKYFLGDDCKRGHGLNGKTVRRKRQDTIKGSCVFCEKINSSNHYKVKDNKRFGHNRKVDIDHLREELEIKKISEESFLNDA
jgi:hypothetical protein